MKKRMPEGINIRHGRPCPGRDGGRCRCSPTYQGQVWSARDGKRLSRSFPTLAAAKAWRADSLVALRTGTLAPPSRRTLREAAAEWVAGARDGKITKRNGQPYKPSVVRGYQQALRDRVLPEFGGALLSELRHFDIQEFVDRMRAAGLDASTVRNTIAPVRVIYRRAVSRG
ncbi:MAG: hypothetical protein ACREIV_15105, partial [Planctomycetaceae bacterium]